jgi:hypothetical protein
MRSKARKHRKVTTRKGPNRRHHNNAGRTHLRRGGGSLRAAILANQLDADAPKFFEPQDLRFIGDQRPQCPPGTTKDGA